MFPLWKAVGIKGKVSKYIVRETTVVKAMDCGTRVHAIYWRRSRE